MSEITYQSNVAGILRKPSGEIWIGERLKVPQAWQFPQGGVDPGETLEQALARELWEEIGMFPEDYRDRRKARTVPLPVRRRATRSRVMPARSSTTFSAIFSAMISAINIAMEHPEFRAWRWVTPTSFRLEWLPEMKVEVYRAVFRDLLGVNL